MVTLEQDVRKMEDMREENTLRDMDDEVDLRDTMKYESLMDKK